ncbi:hypothetical protein D9611_003563 [Ephemerocybe angulata]|uniref:Uncharacterized protein n=1 Tax=Ephemerocybe angulata TaxID=980116 RepID=A0A8H5EYH5_9AGAR|nr:hypothetical protein D9611_003563 [Tulosesus angulatus]
MTVDISAQQLQTYTFPNISANDDPSECTQPPHDDDHAQKRAKLSHSRKPAFARHQRSVSLPSPTLVSKMYSTGANSVLKRKFEQCSSSMQPVPEEEPLDDAMDESDDSTTEEADASSPDSERSLDDLNAENTARFYPYLHHEPERLALERLEEAKRVHEQDKAFYTREIRNMRMLLFEAESTLQNRTEELEFIMKEREEDMSEWEAQKAEMLRRAEVEKEELREKNRALQAELDWKSRECSDAMDVLEEAQRELLGVPLQDLEGRNEGDSAGPTKDGSSSPRPTPASSMSTLSRYTSIPSRITSLRQRLSEDEGRFQAAYHAWSNENRHLRKLHHKQLQTLNEDLRKSRAEVEGLAAENKKLMSTVGNLKESLAASKRDSWHSMSSIRKSREAPAPSSSPSLTAAPDRITTEEAIKLVQKLNMRISEAASLLAKDLVAAREDASMPVAPGDWDHPALTREAVWLLGGEGVTSQLTFIPPPSKSKDNELLRTLLQVALTNWSAHQVHSWDLNETKAGSTQESPLAAIYRKLKIVEDPAVAGAWRSLARAQLKFSSSAWTRALISSIHSVFSFLGLTYSRSVTSMGRELQPLLQALRAVREATGELAGSTELEVATVWPGTRFDFRHMKDARPGTVSSGSKASTPQSSQADSSTRRRKPDVVVATLGLGLKVSEGPETKRLLALPLILREKSMAELLASV